MTLDPNNLEGAPRTREEMAENFRELNKAAPTPAEKFQLMFGADRDAMKLGPEDRRILLDPPQPDELPEDHPLWCVNVQIKELLQGFGAYEDHESVLRFLSSTGLPEGTVRRIHKAIVNAETSKP